MTQARIFSLGALALAALSARAQTSPPITVVVDGNPVVFGDQQPQESNDRVLVPLRGVFEKLGASVDWAPATQTITARKRRITVTLTIGQLDASVSGTPVHMDIPAALVGGTTMVPLRFVSEALGAHVRWNATAHEVDITSSTDYDIPRHDDGPPPRRVIPNRPPPPPPVQQVIVIPADSVVPLTLNTRLSSVNAQIGDPFTVTLNTYGQRWYLGMPAGTTGYGRVWFARPQNGRNPGMIELHFDGLILPNGRHIPIDGRLIGLDDESVFHGPNGRIIARSHDRPDKVVLTGFGAGPGVVIGVHLKTAIGNVQLGGVFGGAVAERQRQQPRAQVWSRPRDVELRPGSPIGLRLYQDLVLPH